jgi:hypothetical protein
MKRFLSLAFGWLMLVSATAETPQWRPAQIDRLLVWLDSAADDALAPVATEAPKVRAAQAAGDAAQLDIVATAAAIRLLRAELQGCCDAATRAGWKIVNTAAYGDPGAKVANAVAGDRIDALFTEARPSAPFYAALRDAYTRETDPARKSTLAANMDRWRWMPRALGHRYLLVNQAAFEATLWDDNVMVGRWRVIVGKTKSPTPIFQAMVTGVTFNPWWEIPSSIVAESVGKMMRNHPGQAAKKGYVIQNGRYRQRPGPDNSLGRMKLVMPNPYNVYLHDTPAQSLFAKNVRTFSHGCIRVGEALDLATTLLAPLQGWDRARSDEMVAAGETVTVPIAAAIPVYVTYFTAEPDGVGGIRFFPDVYHRDHAPPLTSDADTSCKA